MKKLIARIFALLLLFALAACGGGGGGGGGGGAAGNVTPGDINYTDTLVSYADSDLLANMTGPLANYYVKRNADGIEISLSGTGNMTQPATFLKDSFQQEGKFKVSSLTDNDAEHTIYLGGLGTQLEYSEFGIWMERGGGNFVITFKIGDSEAAVIPQTNEAFTGYAVATHTNGDKPHPGTARMQHSGGTSWTLDMTFPEAFDIKIAKIAMSDSGGFKHNADTVVTVDTAAYDAYAPFEVGTAEIYGQFYGCPEQGKASEAVGDFVLRSTNAKYIHGAFGLKKE